jgi:ribonuclease HI
MEVYTDGACSGNGKTNALGAWAFAVVKDDKLLYAEADLLPEATNQRVELLAAIMGLEKLNLGFDLVTVYSDSAYLVNCYEQNWWSMWQKNGWKNSKKQPVANRELWERLIPFFMNQQITFKKVKGHAGVKWNEFVDSKARLLIERSRNEDK